jgi:recombinational DNA repair protein RecT
MNAQTIDSVIQAVTPDYTATIKKHNYSLIPDSQLLAARRQIEKNDSAMKVAMQNPQSLFDSVMTAAILGADLTEGKKQGWLIPRKGVICFQIGYRGIEAIHQRLGVIDRLSVRVVRNGDEFDWSGDDAEKPKHKADWFEDGRSEKPIVGAFCITYFPDKTFHVITSPIDTIYEKHRNKSDSWKNEKARQYSPWMQFEEQMVLKTILIIASKQWPASKMSTAEASPVLQVLHENEVADYSLEPPKETDGRFMGFLLADDSLGLYLLEREYMSEGSDSKKASEWIDFFNEFPNGFKVKNKEKVISMVKQGADVLLAVEDAIASNDAFALSENISDDRECKKLLSAHIGREKTADIKRLLSEIVD